MKAGEAREVLDRAESILRRAREAQDRAWALDEKLRTLVERQAGLSSQEAAPSESLLAVLAREDRLLQWLKWRQFVLAAEEGAKEALKRDDLPVIGQYGRVLALALKKLDQTQCRALREEAGLRAASVMRAAAQCLRSRLKADLSSLDYPACVTGDVAVNVKGLHSLNKEESLKAFQSHFNLMLTLNALNLDQCEDEDGLSPALTLLEPLKHRFHYHFTSNRKTNSLARPEWYLQQVRLWLANFGRFWSASAPSEAADEALIVKQSLLALAAEKLRSDLPALEKDDALLSHALDEVLAFSKDKVILEASSSCMNPPCTPIAVICEDPINLKWLALERKSAFSRVDAIADEDGSWLAPSAVAPDSLRCAEAFMLLLQSLVSRFRPAEDEAKVGLRFLALMLDLLEDFRLRLVKVVRDAEESCLSSSSSLPMALNSGLILADTLEEWREMSVFIRLDHHSKSKEALFSSSVDGFRFLLKESTDRVAESIVYEVMKR